MKSFRDIQYFDVYKACMILHYSWASAYNKGQNTKRLDQTIYFPFNN